MKAQSMQLSRIISIDQGAREHYHVPKYQREYTWGKRDWERIVQDIDENDRGYFMGSIICVRDSDAEDHGGEIVYEVVDGQQRLTTISLMMAAIYERLSEIRKTLQFDDDDDRQEFENSLSSLRNKLVKKKKKEEGPKNEPAGWVEQAKKCFLRVQPSSQNQNLVDYLFILGSVGIIQPREKPRYHGVRLVAKAFKYFQEQIPESTEELLELVAKINQLYFVHISVNSQADAFTLFETLNNRGVPLSAIDIIKNKILAEMEKQHNVDIDQSYDQWQKIVAAIPDTSDQERFLRHYYHANRWDKDIRVDGIPRAIKSKIIAIYEKLIKRSAQKTFDGLCEAAELYGKLIAPSEDDFDDDIRDQLDDLNCINAAPSYQLLLYLFSRDPKQLAGADFLSRSLDLIRKFYVRRNITDIPGTRDLDQGHIDLIAACQKEIESGTKLSFDFLRSKLLVKDSVCSNAEFKEILEGDMYSTNAPMTRYLLVKLDEAHHTREYAPDLWARNDSDKYVWTIEHVLPQTEKLSKEWIDDLADGDRDAAADIQWENVDRLGNLTLSGYNSKLTTSPFLKKQQLAKNKKVLGHSINIGYRNLLALNSMTFPVDGRSFSLANAKTWNADMIEARTQVMVAALLEMYTFEGFDDKTTGRSKKPS